MQKVYEGLNTHKECRSSAPTPVRSSGKEDKENEERFYEWVAGIIDGDGCFLLSKKGYASLEIVTQLRDKKCLYLIKQKLGGAVKLYSGDNYLRYR